MSLFSKADRGNTLSNVAIQTASYLRRRREFESVAYRAGYDALRGRVDDRSPNHDHYCEFHEKCGLIFSAISVPARKKRASSSTATSPVQQRNRQVIGCRSCSRFCLRAGSQCTLPEHLSGNPVHAKHHCAPVISELIRPYPLGSISHGPDMPPDLRGFSAEQTEQELLERFWSSDRLRSGAVSGYTISCTGSFLDRVERTMKLNTGITWPAKPTDTEKFTLGTPCLAEDLMAGFYYRSLQIATSVLHKCKIGYCRSSWKVKCKRRLPCETLEPEMRFDSNIQRVIHQRRNLYDDARVTSHSPELLLRTGMNIQINVHHPDDAHQSLATCVVERLRSFRLSIS